MKTYRMTLRRMMMTVLMMLITVSAMSAEQKIWLRYSSGGKAKISLDGKGLELDKENKATVKDAAGLKVAVTATPDDGYTVSSVTAQLTTDAGNATRGADDAGFLEVTKSGSEYIFTMPEAGFNVVINVNFTYESSRKGGNSVPIIKGDFSGKYYIGTVNTTDGYYLCPTENWYYYQSSSPYYTNNADSDPDKVMPFLTTYKCKSTSGYDASKALWEIRKHDSQNYYYIIHVNSGKYLTYNDAFLSDNKGRMRVHLEKSPANDDYALFKIEYYSTAGSYDIISKYAEDNNIDPDNNKPRKYLNINKGNKQDLTGTIDNVVNGVNTGGIIGLWTTGSSEQQGTGRFFLEDFIPRPTIGYDASGNIKITNNATSATVYYSIGENSDPKTSESYFSDASTTLDSFRDGDIIKAVATDGNEYSNVVTFTAVVHVGSSNQYLIQNLERTDFYMIPGDVSSGNTTVNTTSLFRPTMSWYFSDAGSVGGVQFYYIINGSTGGFLYFNNNSVYVKTSSDFDSSDGYRFFIEQGYKAENDPDGFHIVPKAQFSDNTYCIYKGGWNDTTPPTIANSKADAMKGGTNARRPEQKHTRWNFVQPNTLNKTAPFTVSDASTHITKFYKIASVGSSGYYIVPPTGNNTNATTSNSADAAVVKSGTWYFEKAQDATDADWCIYYYIRNAETGKYLYFTKDANNSGACLEMRSTIEGVNEDRYMFTWAKTAEENTNYYIVPKQLKNVSLNSISSLQRNNGTLQSNITRSAGNYAWTFEDAAMFCNNPVFQELGENIVISCIPSSAEIRYTTDGSDPSEDGVTYSVYPPTSPFSKSGQRLIKAYAVVSDGASPTPNTASSEVITFIKNPDVTFVEGNELPYAAGAAVEPEVSSVTITPEGGSTITIDATEYSVTYSNNTDVGEATVTISDALPENNIIISGTSIFNIIKRSLGDGITASDGILITVTKTPSGDTYTYSVTVTNGTIALTENTDYSLTDEISDDSGYRATIAAIDNSNYSGGAKIIYVSADFPTTTDEHSGGAAAVYQATTDLAAPSDLKACIVTGVDYNTGTVEVRELTYIPKDVPILLLTVQGDPHTADFTASAYKVGEEGAAAVSDNILRKSDGSVPADWGEYYIFSKGEFVLSMGDKTVKVGKYYFENDKYVDSTPAPTRLSFTRGATTAINGIVSQKEKDSRSSVWYTIDGQKLNQKPTRKGIYIHNGHKIIVK